ncbi:MAG: hypothetical protein QNJ16_15280 [Rhodobacter sp.]|nr:hypothetical protein [Rhodobacter sp.]
MSSRLLGIACAAAFGLAGTAVAAEVEARIQSGSLSFSGGNNYTNAQLMITGPQGYEAEQTASRGLPIFRVQGAGRMVDGLYQYSLVAATDEKVPLKNALNNGRGPDARQHAFKPFSMYGAFRVEKGVLMPADETKSGVDGDATE